MQEDIAQTIMHNYYYSNNEMIIVRNKVYENGHQMAPEAQQSAAFSPLSSSQRQSSL